MVDGVNKSPTGFSSLKLKGTKGKQIDLQNIKGLQKTKNNEALFTRYDKDGNGVIDEKEAISMRNELQSIAGNKTISQKEINSFGGDNAFSALNALADQQKAIKDGKSYTETNNGVTTHYGSVKGSEYTETTNDDGSKTYENSNIKETIYKDGSSQILNKSNGTTKETNADGYKTYYDAQGNKTAFESPDGKSLEEFYPGTNQRSSIKNTTTTEDGKEVSITTKYSEDGKKTSRTETSGNDSITKNYNQDGTVKNVVVSDRNTEITYASEADELADRPQQEILNKNNDTLKQTITYTYDSKGNVKAETKDSAGQITTKYTNSKGEEINSKDFDAPTTYTVKTGDSITKIATAALKEQGIENPTEEQLKSAKQQLIASNDDGQKVGTYTKPNTKYTGNRFFYPNTEITIPKFEFNKTESKSGIKQPIEEKTTELQELTVTAPKISEEMKAKRQEAQTILESDFEVGYAADGKSLEVRNLDGNIDKDLTKLVNSDNEDDINTMMQKDANKNGTLDKTEYKNFILNFIANSGQIEITQDNEQAIHQLIDNSFNSMDSIKQDGALTRDELRQNAPQILEQLMEQINQTTTGENKTKTDFIDDPQKRETNTDNYLT